MKATNKQTTSKATNYINACKTIKANLQSISALWKRLHDKEISGTIALAIPVIDDAKAFANFVEYMKHRHKLEGKQNPNRGWSEWYAAQWAICVIKRASIDKDCKQHDAACKFLREAKLAKQAGDAEAKAAGLKQ